jgi:hypothetical protein
MAAHTNYPESVPFLIPPSPELTHPRGFPINPLKNPLYWLQDQLSRFSPVERARAARQAWYTSDGYGYFAQHSTRPQTLSYSLQDSPAGLLAWVLEKLHEWSDPAREWEDDEVLDWAALYWLAPAGPGATLHNYYERAHESIPELEEYVQVPYGVSFFPQEIQQPSLPCAPPLFGRACADCRGSGGYMRRTTSCSRLSTTRVATLRSTRCPRRSSATSAACSGAVGQRLASCRGRRATERLDVQGPFTRMYEKRMYSAHYAVARSVGQYLQV